MSRELLEECKQAILANLQKWQYKDEVALYNVLQKIETELAKPEPEPVAIVERRNQEHSTVSLLVKKRYPVGTKFYTSPPSREPLSDDEIMQVIDGALHLVKKLA
jgi:hypothetical protein